jgi:hypothetical protein
VKRGVQDGRIGRQTLVEIGVDKNTTVVFPAPLMSTIQELGAFLVRETAAVTAAGGHPSANGSPGRHGPSEVKS